MGIKNRQPEASGEYVLSSTAGETVHSFVPAKLPPRPLPKYENWFDLYGEAERALGRLDSIKSTLPDPDLFINMYVRKEALLSSQIEGTRSTFTEILLFEQDSRKFDSLSEIREVVNCIDAMNRGVDLIKQEFPISTRFMKELHGILLKQGRGSKQNPGEFRRSQNWINGTRPGNAEFVPPPHERVVECMSDLEKYIHSRHDKIPLLVRAALVHVQFETIHPFLDGNGRLGRLLITMMLLAEKTISEPLLCLSLYFKAHRDEYYKHLQTVRTRSKWDAWIVFFLTGVIESSNQAVETAESILKLCRQDEEKVAQNVHSPTALQVHKFAQNMPIVSVPMLATKLTQTPPTLRKAVEALCKLEILSEISGKRRDRIYQYKTYMSILERGAEPLDS